MKKIELLVLKLRDFKGTKDVEIQLDGESVKVYGDNGTGKTTVFDAFLWLLFDKDSNNRKDFAIKSLNDDGSEKHNLEHTVEAILRIEGSEISLKKVYKEKWQAKRGTAKKTFTGHDILYYIDEVPVKKKEYVSKIESIVDEETFKLLTSPTYFNEQVHWQDKRNLLIDICGDISDEDVISSNTELSKLSELLNGKSMEDMKKIIAAKKKSINDDLEMIPVRIDEINKMIPDESEDFGTVRLNLTLVEKEINELNEQKMNIKSGGSVFEIQRNIQEIAIKMDQLKRDIESDSINEVHKLQVRCQEATGNVQIVESEIKNKRYEMDSIHQKMNYTTADINRCDIELNSLREQFKRINEESFTHNQECECPTCGQSLPGDKLKAAREEAEASFNANKSELLLKIREQGQRLGAEKDKLVNDLAKQNEELETQTNLLQPLDERLENAKKELAKYSKKFEEAKNSVPDLIENGKYKELLASQQHFNTKLKEHQEFAEEAMRDIEKEIINKRSEWNNIQSKLGQYANVKDLKERIIELEDKQLQLAREYEKLEQTTFLIEEFTRTKVNMLTERINSKFKYARFKLFETQINGGLSETCQCTVGGVPYSSLNNASRINSGIDIINAISAHVGVSAPIFIDNSESVTEFIEVDSQMINLIVSQDDKTLRIEKGGN